MKIRNIMLPTFLTIALFTCSQGPVNPRMGTAEDYTVSFFAAGLDNIPSNVFNQSTDIYFVIQGSNISGEVISENAAFPAALNIQVYNSVGESVFEHVFSEQLPEDIHINPGKVISYSCRWSTFNDVPVSLNTPVPKGIYTASLLYWKHGDSAVACTLTIQ